MPDTIKRKQGWMEEYASCACSFVGKTRAELPGYCGKHGNNRKHLYRVDMDESMEMGQS